MNFQSVTIGQYYPGDSPLHRLDPRTKLLAVLLMSVVVFLPRGWPGYVVAGGFVMAAVLLSRVPLILFLRGLRPLLWILVLATVFNAFLVPGEALFKLGQWAVTKEGLLLSVASAARLVMLVTSASLMTLTTSPVMLTDGLERLLRPLARLGVPAHELALMMTIALRFIPTLMEEADRIIRAQVARGADIQSGSLLNRGKALIPVMVPLFVSSFRRADELAVAMEARGYRGGQGRTRMKELAFGYRDVAAWAMLALFAAAVISLRVVSLPQG